jgi:hypothetical protein
VIDDQAERMRMPIDVAVGQSTLFIRREAFERAGLTRVAIDERLGLTPDEFHVEGQLIVVGPVPDDAAVRDVVDELEGLGLVYFDDYFELSGNWPEWLRLVAVGARA